MKKIFFWIIIVFLILTCIFVGAGIFSFIIADKLYFPNIKEIAQDTGAGLSLSAYQYEPWLWNKEKTTIINIEDRKNDAPYVQYKLKGEVNNVRLIHSGEDFAVIAYSDPNFSSMESGYIVHRSPKSESDNIIEPLHIGGNIIAVAPDESGYFYISHDKIFKRSWQGETLLKAEIGIELEPMLNTQLIGMGSRSSFQPVLFFSNNTKMAFMGTPMRERDGFIFIWDLAKNKIQKISRLKYPNSQNLQVENDKLYFERTNISISKILVAE